MQQLKVAKPILMANFEQICEFDSQINDLYTDNEEELSALCDEELVRQLEYSLDFQNKLAEYENVPAVTAETPDNSAGDCKLRLPDLKCETFNGESGNAFGFRSLFSQFQNVVGLRPNLSKSTKLTYLKSYMRGYAQKLVQHLQITDDNYDTALDLLKTEFLNEDAIVEELIKKLLEIRPKFDQTFLETKIFIMEIRSIVSDLKQYGLDILSFIASSKLLSHIVFHKLPNIFKQELVRKLNNNYPDLDDIFENYVEVVRTLNLKQSKQMDTRGQASGVKSKVPDKFSYYKPEVSSTVVRNNTVGNGGKSAPENKMCKFCTAQGHSMFSCKRYPDYESRIARCKDLNMCNKCSSQKHTNEGNHRPLDFECNICKSKDHIAALCYKVV